MNARRPLSYLTLGLLIPAALSTPAPGAESDAKTPSPEAAVSQEDPYLWLEEVTGKKALDWVARHDARSKKVLTRSRSFKARNARFLEILNSAGRIPFVTKIGALYYNFWQGAGHERGLWRRTTLAEYRKAEPQWETVLDLDALGKQEKENWVWQGATPLHPDATRCLLSLSRGGADATVMREFDLGTKGFVEDGFTLPEAKSATTWRDLDSLFIGTDFGPGSLTTSGYPRIAKLWKRSTQLTDATVVFEGRPDDVAVYAFRDLTPGFTRDFVLRSITFFTNELYLLREGQAIKIDKPDDATADAHREWLLIFLRTDWAVGGRTWPAGSLISSRLDDFLAGKRQFDLLFEPGERRSLADYSPTRNAILLNELDNVKSRVEVLRHQNGTWSRAPLPGMPEFGAIAASAVDDFASDDYFLTVTDFLTPTTLYLGTAGKGEPEKLKQAPVFFDAKDLVASQHEAVSKDGTGIPYFQVGPRDRKLDGSAPTLLTGYGGFEVSEVPYYSGTRGSAWMEQGGVLVLANIRGGGEFGPRWHEAALKANRTRAYEDFIAVAEDLIARKVTSSAHLGCLGGSNGGLLVGNMLTMRPDLFGAIVCQQPLLDMRRYSKLLAGASWIGEYGDPDDPKEWEFLRTFSPYHHVTKDAAYPPTLFTSSTRDDRVHPGHARKMVAKMEAEGHDVLYYENVEGGHAGAADNSQKAFLSALEYEFLWRHLK